MVSNTAAVVIATFLVGLLTGACAAVGTTRLELRREAIEAGVAEWTINPQTGATAFVWKKPVAHAE